MQKIALSGGAGTWPGTPGWQIKSGGSDTRHRHQDFRVARDTPSTPAKSRERPFNRVFYPPTDHLCTPNIQQIDVAVRRSRTSLRNHR